MGLPNGQWPYAYFQDIGVAITKAWTQTYRKFVGKTFFFTYCVNDCMFVYSMCNSVLLFVSHCFALSWQSHSCKWELVLNWPTWLNKGEINKLVCWQAG
jgi:hypothetical protein